MSKNVSSHSPFQVDDLVLETMPEDNRLWVPQTDTVSFRPILFNVSNGYWINLLKITRAGILNKHLHPAPVFGYVLKGSWRYLEHDWVAKEGSFVYEPPGEVHTLIVDEDVEEMIQELRSKLAKKVYESANLYVKLQEYESAIIYLNSLLDIYYDTSWADEGRLLYVQLYLKLV